MNKITFGMRLKIAMVLADMRTKELAAATGIREERLYQMRADYRIPQPEELLAMARVMEPKWPGCAALLIGGNYEKAL